MRINKVSLENFKCFKCVDLELGKLTLLTGANSSGKSSILYSILGALQSGEFPFQFSPNGKYVNMGNFREMAYKNLNENIIRVGLKIEASDNREINLTTGWEEDSVRKLPKLSNLALGAGVFELEIKKEGKYILYFKSLVKNFTDEDVEWLEHEPFLYELTDIIIDGIKEAPLGKSISYSVNSLNELFKSHSKNNHTFIEVILDSLKPLFIRLDNRINFISSFRLHPERTYYETTKTDFKVGKFGEDCVNQVILWETQKAKEYRELIKIMKNLSLFESINSKRLEGGRFELLVKANKNSMFTSIYDVGFGISQFLPIVVADLQLGEGSSLFVEQPEIHLHPSAQAEFGNYMVNQINQARKNYIIETHSEYLLNRIRLAIVKGEIQKDDVKVYYLQNDGEETQTHRLEFTSNGRILNAPEDFFKTYQMDVLNIAMNANAE